VREAAQRIVGDIARAGEKAPPQREEVNVTEIVREATGGRLWATPNEVSGATFHFTLPIAGAQDANVAAADATHLDAGPAGTG
jgi:hypothetical protein